MKPFFKIATLLSFILLSALSPFQSVWAQRLEAARSEATNSLYLPMITNQEEGSNNVPTTLPAQLVATWYSGHAPLNDFYDPQTGEWRDVDRVGQMVVFASNGDFTYSDFIRLQVGSCQSEVSTFKQGKASVAGNALTLTPTVAKTRSVMICGAVHERFTEGPYDPIIQKWTFKDGADGHEQLTIGTASEAVTYNKAGMVNSLVGVWQINGLTPDGFYDLATHQFDLAGGEGMWFDFAADGSYRYGEHRSSTPDNQGCFDEWWIYQQGTMQIVGGNLTVTAASGERRWRNPCRSGQETQASWLSDAPDYTWFYRDRASEVKLVMIPLALPVELVFQRP